MADNQGKMFESGSLLVLNSKLTESTQTITLSTQNKYVKNNINLNLTTQKAEMTAGVAVGDTTIYDDTNDTDINPNLVSGLFSCTATNSTFSKSGDITFTLTDSQLRALAGKTLIFSYDYSIEGNRTNGTSSSSGDQFGIYGFFVYIKSGFGTNPSGTVSVKPFSDALTISGTGRAVMKWVVPRDIGNITTNLTFMIKCDSPLYAKPADSGVTWYIKNVKLEVGTNATTWVPNSAGTGIINLGSKVTLASGLADKYYIPLKTIGSGYANITQKGWIEEGTTPTTQIINTNYINIPEATFANITTTTATSKVQLISKEGYTENKYISALTVPAKKTLDTLTLASGDSSARTYLSTLDVNDYTIVRNINLSGIITTVTANGGYIGTVNLDNENSYIGNVYGAGYIITSNGNTLAKYTQNGTVTTYEGSGKITNYSNVGTITNMTGRRIITNLGTSSATGTLNITTNTYGTINVWGGKTRDKGVTIENHVVTVDGNGTKAGTEVTNSSGDLITTSLSFSGGAPSITEHSNSIAVTGMVTSNTATNYYVKATAKAKATRAAVTYTNATAGWLSAHTSETQAQDSDTSLESSFESAITYIKSGVLANSATTNVTYSENTSVAIPSQGALYINAGYYPDTMITLDQMLDGKTDTAGTANKQILSGYVAYDVDGKKLTGKMPNRSNYTVDANDMIGHDPGKVWVRYPYGYYAATSAKVDCSYLYVPDSYFGDATATQVLSGTTFTSSAGYKVPGAIPVIDGDKQDALSVGWSSLSTKSGKLYIGIPGDTYYKKADSAGAYIYVSPSQLPQAAFASNVTTASSGGVPLVSTAGYTGIKNLTAVTIAAGKTLGSASAAGVTLSAKDSSNNISQMYVTMNTGSKIYLKDANSGKTWIIESDGTNNSLNIWQE